MHGDIGEQAAEVGSASADTAGLLQLEPEGPSPGQEQNLGGFDPKPRIQ